MYYVIFKEISCSLNLGNSEERLSFTMKFASCFFLSTNYSSKNAMIAQIDVKKGYYCTESFLDAFKTLRWERSLFFLIDKLFVVRFLERQHLLDPF